MPSFAGLLDLLQREHRCIERVLEALAAFAAGAGRGDTELDAVAERQRLLAFVRFLRAYADALHHDKEERILFAALRQRPFSLELGAVVAGVCREHGTARLLTDDLQQLGRAPEPWSAVQRARLVGAVGEYVSLLRKHIADEDARVLPAVAACVGAAGMRTVDAACERFEAERAEQRRRLEDLATELCAAATEQASTSGPLLPVGSVPPG